MVDSEFYNAVDLRRMTHKLSIKNSRALNLNKKILKQLSSTGQVYDLKVKLDANIIQYYNPFNPCQQLFFQTDT